MGQIFSWIRGPRDAQALQDVSVEEVCAKCVLFIFFVCLCAYTIVANLNVST